MNKFETELDGRPVTVVGPIDTDDDRRELRADTNFHDGTVALLTYPSQVLAFHGTEPPRMTPIPPGARLAKDEAGTMQVVHPSPGVRDLVAAMTNLA